MESGWARGVPSSRATTTSAVCRTSWISRRLIEPLRLLFKDEVRGRPRARSAGESGHAPAVPGPGSGHPRHRRMTEEKLDICGMRTPSSGEEIEARPRLDRTISQYFAVLTEYARSVGVMGDERTYDYTAGAAQRHDDDFMTARTGGRASRMMSSTADLRPHRQRGQGHQHSRAIGFCVWRYCNDS